MNQNIIQPLMILTGTMPLIDTKYFELGIAALMISMLLWFGRNAIKKDSEREKWLKEQLDKRDNEIAEKDKQILELAKQIGSLNK